MFDRDYLIPEQPLSNDVYPALTAPLRAFGSDEVRCLLQEFWVIRDRYLAAGDDVPQDPRREEFRDKVHEIEARVNRELTESQRQRPVPAGALILVAALTTP